MADIIDDANAKAEFFLANALRERQRNAKKATPHGVGMCLNCGSEVEDDRRWCDAGCRDQWQADNGKR